MFYGPYKATPVNAIDGDTVCMDVVVWPGLTQRVLVRLRGVNTPEMRGMLCEREAAIAARLFTAGFVAKGDIVISRVQHDKFAGRVNADVYVDGASLAEALLENGFAVKYSGGKREVLCV